jgi:signal peptidase I
MAEHVSMHRSSIKETLTQLVIAFVMAFVFRGFVIEAFLIPTGSMAPTLMGAHMRFRGLDSGYQWAVGPWDYVGGTQAGPPMAIQGRTRPVEVTDPMTGSAFAAANQPILGGDRIFVLKYLPSIFDPQRFDCVVFKNPTNPDENYIKRLIGLPGEQIALIHGDVFVRDARSASAGPADWHAPDWRIARKPERVQQSLWMPLFSSEYSPIGPQHAGWQPPWIGSPGFEVGQSPTYTYTGAHGAAGVLRWDHQSRPIDDEYPYNQSPAGAQSQERYLVPDVRLRAGIQPDAPGVVVSAIVTASGHEFRADIDGAAITIRSRPVPMPDALGSDAPGEWTRLGGGALPGGLATGRVTDIEFWHADQALHVYANGTRVASAQYDWTPRERILHATGRSIDQLLEQQDAAWDQVAELVRRGGGFDERIATHRRGANIFTAVQEYRPTRARWEFTGPVTLHRVGLDRDLYYHPGIYARHDGMGQPHPRASRPAMATHPEQPALLRQGQYFVCGDNSAASLDARLWGAPDPWVAATIDPTIGVVPRDLLIGKAFFVYFPAMHRERRVPMVDFGRMRFIW